jgi:hypothetical protein
LKILCACGAAYKMSTSISSIVIEEEASIFYLSIDCIG